MAINEQEFFSASLTAGAILTGFCGTFLSFRIQREANYYRQPAVDYASGKAKDVSVGLSNLSSGFFLLIIASLAAMLFGFIAPLLRLSGLGEGLITVGTVTGGLLSSLALICGYFLAELRHYEIRPGRTPSSRAEWRRQMGLVNASVLIAAAVFFFVVWLLP